MSKRNMPGYMTYREAAIMFSLMPEEEAAAAIKATVNYFLWGKVAELEGSPAQVFEIMCASIDKGRDAYEKKCKGGEKGNEARYGKKDS